VRAHEKKNRRDPRHGDAHRCTRQKPEQSVRNGQPSSLLAAGGARDADRMGFLLAATLALATTAAAPIEVAPGVHVLVHADATDSWPHGNTVVVIGERGVLVVDATYLPSAARADIAAIRKLTPRPVRWLVNTHWHYDHNFGNAAYRQAFPGVEIIAHVETRRLMDANVPRYAKTVITDGAAPRKELAAMRARLASGKDDAGGALAGQALAKLRDDIARRENEQRELAAWSYAGPTLAYRDELRLDLGGREAHVLHLGRGNTPGDSVVWLPAEKVVAAGDLVVAPVPYAWSSYPAEWIPTLRRLVGLGATTIVPGHGPVMKDHAYVAEVIALLESVTSQVARLSARNLTADEVRRSIDLAAAKERFCAGDAEREEVWASSIETALVDRAWSWSRGGL
jgi:glyoxylase-like metal-dependent hydrolase (beta-lactamase superfamily II)